MLLFCDLGVIRDHLHSQALFRNIYIPQQNLAQSNSNKKECEAPHCLVQTQEKAMTLRAPEQTNHNRKLEASSLQEDNREKDNPN
jgi:hypothetical protein